MSKKSKYRVTNWREYNASLKQRGSLSFWINEELEKNPQKQAVLLPILTYALKQS